jgi:hypothetical protein
LGRGNIFLLGSYDIVEGVYGDCFYFGFVFEEMLHGINGRN